MASSDASAPTQTAGRTDGESNRGSVDRKPSADLVVSVGGTEKEEGWTTAFLSSTASPTTTRPRSILPLSMRLLRCMGGVGFCNCNRSSRSAAAADGFSGGEYYDIAVPNNNNKSRNSSRGYSPLGDGEYCGVIGLNTNWDVSTPGTINNQQVAASSAMAVLEDVLADYRLLCQFYQCENGVNAGVMTSLRYSLPHVRVSVGFGDADMLALADLLLKYGGGGGNPITSSETKGPNNNPQYSPLQHIRRLDFTPPNLRNNNGLTSHGAFALSKVFQTSTHIQHVVLDRNRIGPTGAAAIFHACSNNNNNNNNTNHHSALEQLSMRRCSIGERGGLAFAKYVLASQATRLVSVDLSANNIGYHGCIAIERAALVRETLVQQSESTGYKAISLDLDGNLVFQEIMNSVTHGLGVLLAFVGSHAMSTAVQHQSARHVWSCGIYSTSLVVLYTSSTLYHSFFSLRHTKWVFEVLDRCAIYILIAGSYTPFLHIVLAHEPMWSNGMLAFLWILCFMGVGVEFLFPSWRRKGTFSLAMYLGMGWSAVMCLPEVARILDPNAINLMALGGVAYTAGVPFFVRDNSTFNDTQYLQASMQEFV